MLSFHKKPQDLPLCFVLYTTLAVFESECLFPRSLDLERGEGKRIGDAHAPRN